MSRTVLPPSDIVTLMAALAIAAERFPDASEYEEMRQRLAGSSVVTIETPDRADVIRLARVEVGRIHSPWIEGFCPNYCEHEADHPDYRDADA